MDFPLGKFPRNLEEMCSYWFYEAERKETNQKWGSRLFDDVPTLSWRASAFDTNLLASSAASGVADLCILCPWGLTLERRRLLRSFESSGCLLFSHPIIVSQSYWRVSEAKSNGVDLNESEKLRREEATASTRIGLTRWWH
jgi:hypothetical protein